jgi:nitroimidazol reductase NimA-like FMN-containing flavoprotein (pyridoxamine 5'-phosphate oxidase superfamily)
MALMYEPTMETLNAEECVALLRQAPVGHIGISVDGLPVILPVNYSVVDDAIMFRTIPGSKLAAASESTVVAFEVDSHADDGCTGWSVLVQGVAREVTDSMEREMALACPIRAWALGDRADRVVRIEMQTVSGRRYG